MKDKIKNSLDLQIKSLQEQIDRDLKKLKELKNKRNNL